MYNVDDVLLTSTQLSALHHYAAELDAYDHDPSLKNSAKDTGYDFYFDIYKDGIIANQMVKFDLNANKTLEEYLLDVFLTSQTNLYRTYTKEIELIIPIYAYYLKEAQKDTAKTDQAKAVGAQFYKLWRNTGQSVDKQIEMDLLQHFDRVDEQSLTSHSTLELSGYDHYNDIEDYLRAIGNFYQLPISKYDMDIVEYAVSLQMLYESNGLLIDIKFAYEDGIEFYTKKGMMPAQADSQTRRDILSLYNDLEK